jgi:hypothetical protein
MTFATDILKPSSNRFMLVRLIARRHLTNGTLTDTNQYTFDLTTNDLVLTGVLVNGAYISGNDWVQTGETLVVDSVVNLASSSNIVVIEHATMLTAGQARVTDSESGIVEGTWEPRLVDYPTFEQNSKNLTEGVFTLSLSTIRIIAENGFHRRFFGSGDSLSRAVVQVWMCVDSVNTNQKIFDGEVTSAKFAEGILTLEVIDVFNSLTKTAKFGEDGNSLFYIGNLAFPYPPPSKQNLPIPITLGYSTKLGISYGWRHLDSYGNFTYGTCFHASDGIEAVRVSPETPDGVDPVTFHGGRIVGSLLTLNFGTISAAYEYFVERNLNTDSKLADTGDFHRKSYDRIVLLQCSTFNGHIGDYIPQLGGNVCTIGAANIGFGSYNVAVACPVYGYNQTLVEPNFSGVDGSISVPSIPNNTIPSMSVWVENGTQTEQIHENLPTALIPDSRLVMHGTRYVPFTLANTTYTFNGKTITHVYMTIDPVASNLLLVDQGGALSENPLASATVKCSYRLASPLTHGEALEYIITSAGLSANSASFDQADTDFSGQVSMTVGDNGNSFPTYLELVQKIVSSTFGYVVVNSSREIEYHLFEDPSTPDVYRDNSDILDGSASFSAEYQDICSSVVFENENLRGIFYDSSIVTDAIVSSSLPTYLHGLEKTKVYPHVLKNIDGRKNTIFEYLSNPSHTYQIASASSDLLAKTGDIVFVTNKIAPYYSGTTSGAVVGVSASTKNVTLTINELKGVT